MVVGQNPTVTKLSLPSIDWQELHGMGFSLIPVHVGGKMPAVRWAQYQTQRATPGEIAAWQRVGHNVGIVTGEISGLVVLDCDTPEAIAKAESLGIPCGTVSVGTAKGRHYYFRHPGCPVPNKARLLPGMDVRGDGGFVVAPGSVHPSGTVYTWINDPAWSEIAPLPPWLFERLCNEPVAEVRTIASQTPVTSTTYGQAAFNRELEILCKAPEGKRNDQLNRSAFALAQLVAGGEINAVEARAALHDAAVAIGLDSTEIERTLESGWQSGLREPRAAQSKDAESQQAPAIFSACDLIKMTFPPLQWVLPGFLTEGLAILAGKPKFGKSYLTLQMAVAVSSGDGKSLGIEAIEEGDVLVCALEDSARRLKDRLMRMHPYGNVPDRLHFATTWPTLDQGGLEELEAWCIEHPKARLIIIDTWRAVKPRSGGRSSAYDEDAKAAAPLLEFTKRHPGLAVLVAHHVRKQEAEDPFDMISGTHGLTGIFDTLMVLSRHGSGAKLAAQGRDLESYEKGLERNPRTGGWIVTGNATALAKTGERQELLDLLANANEPLTLAELAQSVGKQPDNTRHLLKALMNEGLVYQPCHGEYAIQHVQDDQFDDDLEIEQVE